ncbi:MAG: hypothetical protein KF789_02415 [Bdellovibrionaceae bacterium]|nr:hypothetical protein [Pseudobdellovibrionaceae bacterium]
MTKMILLIAILGLGSTQAFANAEVHCGEGKDLYQYLDLNSENAGQLKKICDLKQELKQIEKKYAQAIRKERDQLTSKLILGDLDPQREKFVKSLVGYITTDAKFEMERSDFVIIIKEEKAAEIKWALLKNGFSADHVVEGAGFPKKMY